MKKNNIYKIFLFILTFLCILTFGCKKEKIIEPHIEINCETCEIVDGKIELNIGDKIILNTKFISNEETKDLVIEKNSLDMVTMNDGNLITAIGVGTSIFTVNYTDSNGNKYLEDIEVVVCEVEKDIEKILLTNKDVVSVGGVLKIEVNTYGSPLKKDYIYSSSNENIAVIDLDGIIYGLSEGVCEIKVSLADNPSIFSSMTLNVINFKDKTYTEMAGARYYAADASSYKYLPYGVFFQKLTAYTSCPLEGIDVDGYNGLTQEIVANKFYQQQVSLLEVPSCNDIKITSWANLNSNKWTLTTVKGLIRNYEAKNPGWKVVAAINGDFFDINANGNLPYQTTSPLVSNGEFYKTTGSYMVGFTNNGGTNSLIGMKDIIRTPYMILSVYDENGKVIKDFDIQHLNSEPSDDETSVFFAIYGEDKKIIPVEISGSDNLYVVEKADLALPNNSEDFYGKGEITSNDGVVLTIGNFAIKTNNEEVKKYLNKGTKIRCQYRFIGEYENVNDISGCRPRFLLDGEYDSVGDINDRAPRTAIGVKVDGTIVMMVIDGRQGGKNMFGASSQEMAAIMKAYGCVEAFNLDGGGSSTMVIRDGDKFITTNTPSDGHERSDGNCILVVVRDIDFETNVSDITETSANINVSVKDSLGKDIKKLWIKVDNKMHEVINGKVELDGLVSNCLYNYKVYYEDSTGKLIETITGSSFSTNKKKYQYFNTYVLEDEENFKIIIKYLDIDKCSSLGGAKITLNIVKDGEEKTINTFLQGNGEVVLKKKDIGNVINKISVSFSYQIDGMNRELIDLLDVKFILIKK